MRRTVVGVLATIGLLCAPSLARAQTTDIRGTVRNKAGQALPGVIVEARRPDIEPCARAATTDKHGRYEFLAVPLGTYTVAFTPPGGATTARVGVEAAANDLTDTVAAALSDRIQQEHLLYGFIAETQFESPTSRTICWTQGNGDGALWTGNYLAAEAFRYKVTGSLLAKAYLKDALERVRDLALKPPSGFVARTIFPLDSPFIDRFVNDEGHSGLFPIDYRGKDSYWVGHPTRDQYSGVFLGLGVTYDLMYDDEEIRGICRDTITYLVDALIKNHWSIGTPPEHPHQESFRLYRYHRLSALQLAKHVDPKRFGPVYDRERAAFASRLAWVALKFDVWRMRKKYYLVNLDYSYFYNLIQYEKDEPYRKRYLDRFAYLRKKTQAHGNALFNMIERGLIGSDTGHDQETIDALKSLLTRGFKNVSVDLNGKYKSCGKDEACDPIPVAERPYEDFLWQRSPFQMKYDGDGSLESAGIDFILPYWMARYYGVIQ